MRTSTERYHEIPMTEFLNKIREPEKSGSLIAKLGVTLGVLLLGISLGTFSKYLDSSPHYVNYETYDLPAILMAIDNALDLHNFLGGFAPWIVIALCVAVLSKTPLRAAINVLVFFAGFVASYYLYSYFVAGFYPAGYARIWIALTIVSPVLAYITWYAKGTGPVALVVSSIILSALINTAFAYGLLYIDVRSWLNVVMLSLGIVVLRRSAKETAIMLGLSILLAMLFEMFLPFRIW